MYTNVDIADYLGAVSLENTPTFGNLYRAQQVYMPMSIRPICRVSQRRESQLPRGERPREVGTEISGHVYPRLSSVLAFVLLDLAPISRGAKIRLPQSLLWLVQIPLIAPLCFTVV